MKKIILTLLLVIALSACDPALTGHTTELPNNQETSTDPILIGATLALSGNLAYIGEQTLGGTELAVEDINAAGGINGRPLRLIVEDNRGEPSDATKGVQKLVTIDRVPIVISSFTHITNAVKDIVVDNGALLYYASTYPDFAEQSPYVFRDFFSAGDMGESLAHTIEDDGIETVAILSEISDQCALFEERFRATTTAQILIAEHYPVERKDLRTELLKIAESDPHALVLCTWRHEHIVMPALAELGIAQPTYHLLAGYLPVSDTLGMRELYERQGSTNYWYGFTAESMTSEQKVFADRFGGRYGVPATSDAAYAYDDVIVLAAALEACDGVDRDCLSRALLQTTYDGVGGSLSFDASGNARREVFPTIVKDGQWVAR